MSYKYSVVVAPVNVKFQEECFALQAFDDVADEGKG